MVLGPSAVISTSALIFYPLQILGRCLRVRRLTCTDILIAASSQSVIK